MNQTREMLKSRNCKFNNDDFFVEQDNDVIFDSYPPRDKVEAFPNYYRQLGVISEAPNYKFTRLRRINKWLEKDDKKRYNMGIHFDYLMTHFNLPESVEKYIRNEVLERKPYFIQEVIKFTFESIIKNNFHITTNEFRQVIQTKYCIGDETMKALYANVRDYTWFINKILSKLNLSGEMFHKSYTKVKENFDTLQPVLQANPTSLISVLCRLTYNALRKKGIITHDIRLKEFEIDPSTYSVYRDKLMELGISLPSSHRSGRPKGKNFTRKEIAKRHYEKNRDKYKQYYQRNKSKIRKQQKNYQEKSNYYENNREHIREQQKEYYEKSKN